MKTYVLSLVEYLTTLTKPLNPQILQVGCTFDALVDPYSVMLAMKAVVNAYRLSLEGYNRWEEVNNGLNFPRIPI